MLHTPKTKQPTKRCSLPYLQLCTYISRFAFPLQPQREQGSLSSGDGSKPEAGEWVSPEEMRAAIDKALLQVALSVSLAVCVYVRVRICVSLFLQVAQ